MELREVIKETNRVMVAFDKSAVAYKDADGVLKWASTNLPVGLAIILRNDWLPYSEPERCEACFSADEIEKRDPSQDDSWTRRGVINFTNHLRKYHCTCGKEGR